MEEEDEFRDVYTDLHQSKSDAVALDSNFTPSQHVRPGAGPLPGGPPVGSGGAVGRGRGDWRLPGMKGPSLQNPCTDLHLKTFRDVSSCNTYNYGDALYWDTRYVQEAGSFDWYQRYSALRPFVRKYVASSARVLMVGCGNAVMSEDMVKDGYEEIMNIDISSVAIDMMRRKYEHIPQLKYMQMDVRDMSFFPDDSFDAVIDKGTLDSLMCGTDAPISASQMLGEISRLLKPGGVYMLITYGDPNVRMPHLGRGVYNWMIKLYVIPRPGFEGPTTSSMKSYLEPIPLTEKGLLPTDFVLEDPDCHFIYVCKKMEEMVSTNPSIL